MIKYAALIEIHIDFTIKLMEVVYIIEYYITRRNYSNKRRAVATQSINRCGISLK